MTKIIQRTLLAVLALTLCFSLSVQAQAAAPFTGLVLAIDLPGDAQIVEDVTDAQGNYTQVLSVGDGAIMLTTIRQRIDAQYPMEMELPRFLSFYFEDVRDLETLAADPAQGYPAERARFTTGNNEDTAVIEAVFIRADEWHFALFAKASADTYYGYMDGYQEGDIPKLIDGWVQSLDLVDSGTADPGM